MAFLNLTGGTRGISQCLGRLNPFFFAFLFSSLEVGLWLPGHHLLSLASATIALTGPILILRNKAVIGTTLKREPILFLLLFFFLLVIFASMILSGNHAVAKMFSVKYFFQILIFIGLFLSIRKNGIAAKHAFLKGLIYFASLNGFVSIFEKMHTPYSVQIIHFFNKESAIDWSRFPGMFINPNGLGAFQTLGIIALVLFGKELFKKRSFFFANLFFGLAGLFLSASLNGVANLSVFFLGYFFFFGEENLKRFRVYILLFAFIAAIFVRHELVRRIGPLMAVIWDHQNLTIIIHVLDSLKERFNLWHVAMSDIREHPLLGLGAGVFIFSHSIISTVNKQPVLVPSGQLNAHNFELNLAVGFGLLGLSVFLAFLMRALFMMRKDGHWDNIILFAFLFLLQQIDCFLDSYFPWMLAFWGVLAATIAKPVSDVQKSKSIEPLGRKDNSI